MTGRIDFHGLDRVSRVALTPVLAIMSVFAPFAFIVCVLYFAGIIAFFGVGAMLLPFGTSDIAIAEWLRGNGPVATLMLASTMLLALYVAIAWCVRRARGGRMLRPRLAAFFFGGYAAAAVVVPAISGTHPWGQMAYVWSHPGKNAMRAWNCQAKVRSGEAEKTGYYNLVDCSYYVTSDELNAACWQVLRLMKPLDSHPLVRCHRPAIDMTGHDWSSPALYHQINQALRGSVRVPVRNTTPLATPEKMLEILKAHGLTPR